jgi:hypothetical protein
MGQNRNKRAEMFSVGQKVSLTTRQVWISTWSFPELWPTGDFSIAPSRDNDLQRRRVLFRIGGRLR